jgi:hypothetical protein
MRRFDWWGFVTIAVGLFALLLAFSEGQVWGWGSDRVLMLLVGGLLSLALFVVIELEMDEPLFDMAVLAYWPFVNSLLLMCFLVGGQEAGSVYLVEPSERVRVKQPTGGSAEQRELDVGHRREAAPHRCRLG